MSNNGNYPPSHPYVPYGYYYPPYYGNGYVAAPTNAAQNMPPTSNFELPPMTQNFASISRPYNWNSYPPFENHWQFQNNLVQNVDPSLLPFLPSERGHHHSPTPSAAFVETSSLQSNGNRSSYVPSPLNLFSLRGDAVDTASKHYSCLLRRMDSWSTTEGMAYIYQCPVPGCQFRVRVMNMENKPPPCWRVDEHKCHNHHNHPLVEGLVSPNRGIPEAFKVIIDRHCKSLKDIGRQDLSPTEAVQVLLKHFGKDSDYSSYFSPSNAFTLRQQVKRHMSYQKEKSAKGSSINTLSDIIDFTIEKQPTMPPGYVAKEYDSLDSFCSALGCDFDHMFALPIPTSERQRLEEIHATKKDGTSMYQTVVCATPATMYTMLEQSVNTPTGGRLIQVDCTSNATHDGWQIGVIGCHDVRFRAGQSKVTASLHPFGYAVVPGERQACIGVAIDLLKYYFKLFFGTDVDFDWGGSDHSWPIRNGRLVFSCATSM